MAIKDLFSFPKIKNKLNQALYQYWVSEGVANVNPDDLDTYLREGYAKNADVYSIVQRVDNMRKQAKLELYERQKDGTIIPVVDHPLLKFKTKVNSYTPTNLFISEFLIYRMMLGNVFIYHPHIMTGLNKGKTPEIHTMPSNNIEIIEGTMFDPIKGYKLSDNETPFDKSEVYHNKMVDPDWVDQRTLYGMSPLKAAARVVAKQNESENTQLKQFQNQGPKYLVYRDGEGGGLQNRMTDLQKSALTKKIKKAGQGENTGLPLVTKDKYGVINLGQSIADMDIIESSKDGRKVLCNIWCLPPALFGIDNPTFNNMETSTKMAWTDCIIPNLSEVSDCLNACTIDGIEEYQNLFWGFDYSQVEELQTGMEKRVAWMKAAHWTANQIFEATGQKRVDNELMDEPIFSSSEMFLSDMATKLEENGKNTEDYE